MKATKGRPTGKGYPRHLALYHYGTSAWELGCVVCRTWCSSGRGYGRNGAAGFISRHKHCGLGGGHHG